jgi:uncharacterized membrane protein
MTTTATIAASLRITPEALRQRVARWGAERALTTPRTPCRTNLSQRESALSRTLELLVRNGGRLPAATLQRRTGLTRKRLLWALRELERDGRIVRVPAADHNPELPRRHRWVWRAAQ